jgi:outer membrane immunogenic protein
MLRFWLIVAEWVQPIALGHAIAKSHSILKKGLVMKKSLIASVMFGALMAGSAMAADMPARAPMLMKAPPAPVSTWTGFYFGGGFGYGMSDADTSVVQHATGVPLTNTSNSAGKGWLGTVTVGYDYQFNSSIVGGVFADYDFANITGTLATTSAVNFFNVLGGTEKESQAWDVGARLGWLVAPNVLTYWNGGYTQARFDAISINGLQAIGGAPLGLTTMANTYQGWFLGGGVEYQLTFLPLHGLYGRTEYRYATYNSATLPIFTAAGAVGGALGATDLVLKPVVQTIRSEIIFKFN